MDEYIQRGEDIFNTYCKSADNRPVMLPRAPQQTYIDVYPDGPGSTFENDKQRQSDYEAEVLVYRALEKLKEHDMIVLHGFKYTHHQYRLCDKNHERKGCFMCKGNNAANVEGECDFLIIYRNIFIIIEVKNVQSIDLHKQNTKIDHSKDIRSSKLNGTLLKSLEQRKKVTNLIKCVDERMEVLQFTAFPNLSRSSQNEFPQNISKSIIFHENILNFEDWWHQNVYLYSIITERLLKYRFILTYDFQFIMAELIALYKVQYLLLAIWCTDRDTCDLQKCSLGWCVKEIDKKLRTGKFVFRENNPKTISSSTVLKEYLCVDNMTKQQHDIFCSKEKFLWINGPAGSGKSVLLAGKMIELAQKHASNKIILIEFCGKGNNTRLHQRALDKAKVGYCEINLDSDSIYLEQNYSMSDDVSPITVDYQNTCENDRFEGDQSYFEEQEEEKQNTARFKHRAARLNKLILHSKIENQVTIVNFTVTTGENVPLLWLIDNMVELSQEYSIFIDDIQTILSDSLPFHKIKRFFSALSHSSRNSVHVTCDVAQSWFRFFNYSQDFHQMFIDELTNSQLKVVTLSTNLRNTFNVAQVLSVMRNYIVELSNIEMDVSSVLPEQTRGHYIHGPKVNVHVLNNCQDDYLTYFICNELQLLCEEEAFERSDIGLVHDFYWDSKTSYFGHISNALSTQPNKEKGLVSLCKIEHSLSAEFPAVVVLHEMNKNRYSEHIDDLRLLYLAISRARVYCSIILFPEKDTSVEDHEIYSRMLEKLSEVAHVIRY